MTATLTDIAGYRATSQDREELLGKAREAGGQVCLGVEPEFPMVAF
jgi:hypothetical protein